MLAKKSYKLNKIDICAFNLNSLFLGCIISDLPPLMTLEICMESTGLLIAKIKIKIGKNKKKKQCNKSMQKKLQKNRAEINYKKSKHASISLKGLTCELKYIHQPRVMIERCLLVIYFRVCAISQNLLPVPRKGKL